MLLDAVAAAGDHGRSRRSRDRLVCERRSLGRPIAARVRDAPAAQPDARVTVLIAEAEPVRRDTDAVICRLRFRLFRGRGAGRRREPGSRHRRRTAPAGRSRQRRKSPVKGVCAAVRDPSTAAESGQGRGYL
ncbi:hypothetical protein ABTY96_11615 [Streptomyces sp. NPDC096057]|uniref:hypothetical protein n=1 Tax=Streptomyces sp. NPDC096057 TaxID=3155543 RepID=UPI00332A2095